MDEQNFILDILDMARNAAAEKERELKNWLNEHEEDFTLAEAFNLLDSI